MTTTCIHCDAVLSPRDFADGWCDGCGKKLPSGLAKSATRRASAPPPPSEDEPEQALSTGTMVLLGLLALALVYFGATALLGDAQSIAFIVKLAIRLAVVVAVAAPVAFVRALAAR